jgi:hypothetical protein
MKEIAAENWAVCGKMNTGKTHVALEMAFEIQKESGKPILVFDHNNNESYKEITNTLGIEDLENYVLDDNSTWKISGSSDYDYFLELLTLYVRNTIVLLDDCGNYFTGNLSSVQMNFVTASKNNGNDIFYQFHNFNDIAPKLGRNFQMVILKEQAGEIPSKVQAHQRLNILHEEIRLENEKRPTKEKWSYRIYDMYSDDVFVERNGILEKHDGSTYFKNKKYRKL